MHHVIPILHVLAYFQQIFPFKLGTCLQPYSLTAIDNLKLTDSYQISEFWTVEMHKSFFNYVQGFAKCGPKQKENSSLNSTIISRTQFNNRQNTDILYYMYIPTFFFTYYEFAMGFKLQMQLVNSLSILHVHMLASFMLQNKKFHLKITYKECNIHNQSPVSHASPLGPIHLIN